MKAIIKNPNYPYPINLFFAVIGEDYDDYPITDKTIKRFENFLSSFLSSEVTKEEKEILLLYFKDGLSQTRIGKRFNTSHATINNRINKVLFKLRTVKNINQIFFFDEDYKIYIKRIELLIEQLNNPRFDKNNHPVIEQDDSIQTDDVIVDDRIENLKLSKRAFNALKRARINTVTEVVDLLNTIDTETKKNKIYNTINIGIKLLFCADILRL